MKKLVLVSLVMVSGFISASVANCGDKVTILHKQKEVIEISLNALPAHIEHGDIFLVLYNGQWLTQAQYAAITIEFGSSNEN